MKLYEHAFLGRGFRPFFLLGALYAAISVSFWIAQFKGVFYFTQPFDDMVLWHSHEMIFGFTMAIVAGFLLTAVANWTNQPPIRQLPLVTLCLLWLAGRIVMNMEVDFRIAAAIDLTFIPALTISLLLPLLKSWNKRNFVFIILLSILFLSNLFVFLYQDMTWIYVAILIIMIMISVIGGRIIPAFTVAALRREGLDRQSKAQPKMDVAALISLAALAGSVAFLGAVDQTTGIISFIAAGIHIVRMRFYHTREVWHDPLLWSLHLGYLWLVAGLALLALSAFEIISIAPAFHALAVGAIGTLTLSMMCRVTLGHTGRELNVGMATTFAFMLMQLAALTRVVGPIFLPSLYLEAMTSSAIFWSGAFVLYLILYCRFLWLPRPDGKPA